MMTLNEMLTEAELKAVGVKLVDAKAEALPRHIVLHAFRSVNRNFWQQTRQGVD